MEIELYTNNDSAEWDAFVEAHPESTFFHLSRWSEVLSGALRHKPHYLFTRDSSGIAGVLPLVETKSAIFGNTLCSNPFCVTGGPISNSEDAEEALLKAANELANELNVGHLEMRGRRKLNGDWISNELYVNFSKTISDDHDENMKSIPRKQRAMVRKGIKNNLVSNETDDVDRFYRVYSESVRNLGTPVFSKKYFHHLKSAFGEKCRLLVISNSDIDLAAVMSFYYRDQVIPYYGGSVLPARKLQANDFMYWELMRRSADEGIRVFDYGRSKIGSGAFSFKKNWGFEAEQLHYECKLIKSKALPELNPTNKKYSKAIELWKKLPIPIANTLGPYISRTLG